MRYIWQHIDSILQGYNGSMPLTHFLKNYFKQYPKLGSRDRKILSAMAYSWYRCSKAIVQNASTEEKIKCCLFLCESSLPQILPFLPEEWRTKQALPLSKKLTFLKEKGIETDMDVIVAHLSADIGDGLPNSYIEALFYQPKLFIRVLKSNEQKVNKLLIANNLVWETENLHPAFISYSFANGTAIDKVLPADVYVVQDLSSQKTGTYFTPSTSDKWWDCCSGAGGKSLLLKAIEPNAQLTVSDKRETILHNLQKRFHQYHQKQPQMMVADVAEGLTLQKQLAGKLFDKIICDVPCTGSGTWARTPEQLYFFDATTTKEYAKRQQKIAVNAAAYLKPGGTMYYITCSVFKEENEDVVGYVTGNTPLMVKEQALINGLPDKADAMFITVLERMHD